VLVRFFFELRAAGVPVSITEFLTLLAALRSSDPKVVIPPLHGALLKNEQDVHLFERLAFLHRRGQA